ncbi:MAG: hypothetical protein SVY10_11690 [Thermodesulfobacteriota bacterium]|nr:hypothetical protein [Thermodesulfobacteriota bacterium]
MKRNVIRILILFTVILILFVSVLALQITIDKTPEKRESPESLLYLPSGPYIKTAVLGYDELAADILWIKAVLYFGKHVRTDRDFKWLYNMLDIVTTLDPQYEIAYYFGGIVLAWEVDNIELSNKILKKGMENIPHYWFFPFHIGFNYFFSQDQPEIGARYLAIASKLPNCPAYLSSLVGKLYAGSGKQEIALQFLVEGYAEAKRESIKKIYFKQLKEVLGEREYRMLMEKVERFKEQYGSYPPDIKGYLTEDTLRRIR